MSEWQEDNFLERLAHNSKENAVPVLCPEVEALSGGSDSGGVGPISAQLHRHIEHCPLCSDLHRRLDLFDKAESLVLDSEAIEAEKHLGFWLKGFLASESLNLRASTSVSTPREAVSQAPAKTRMLWVMNWALSAAAMILVVAGVVYFRRSVNMQTPVPVVVRTTTDDLPTPAKPSEEPAAPEVNPVGEVQPQVVVPKNPPAPKAPKLFPPSRRNGAPAQRQELAAASEHEKQSAPLAVQGTTSVATEARAVVENQPQSPSGTPMQPTPPPAPISLSHGSTNGIAPGSKPNGTPAHGSETRAAIPSVVLIPAGTRIWISLQTISPQDDGRSQFKGTLLLPVSTSNSLVLAKGTPVAGFGSIAEGQTSIQITALVLNAKQYKLRSELSVRAHPTTRASKAVQFERGTVIELWLDSAAVFEFTESQSAAPQD